jgi:hypothetical protein
MAVGARALHDGRLFEIEPRTYCHELALKRAILAEDLRYYAQELPGSRAAQWECVELVLDTLARDYPHAMLLRKRADRWVLENRLLGETHTLRVGDEASIATFPLDWAGRLVQEDLLLMSGDAEAGFPLVAGQLCFANRWCLDDKLGRSILAIHAPVPGFAEQIGHSTSKLMERIKFGRPVWRLNWSVLTSSELNRPPRTSDVLDMSKAGVTSENAGTRCFFRTERQTLTRLPHSGAILFTVRTYIAPVGELASNSEWRRCMIGILRTAPPELLEYKGMTPFVEPLLSYLETLEACVPRYAFDPRSPDT